ncbi:MAG TPA: serpin family protein [Bacteroidota bacterium]|nr:serpin family protein [Bacteroidota bacterium]
MKYFVIVPIFFLALASCRHSPTETAPVTPPAEFTAVEKNIIAADNNFGLSLFNKLSGEQKNANVIISPLSVSMAFGMLLNGANGATFDSLEQVLGKSGLSSDEMNISYQTISNTLTNLDANVNFQIANSIWYRSGFSVLPKFLSDNQTYFNAEVQALNFSSADAVTTINNWVSTKTNGKIPAVLNGLIPDSIVLYLIDAIYFKGTWTYQFNAANTKNASFTCSNGTVVTCNMMSQESKFAYYADSALQAIDLPYGNGSFSMTILLPTINTDIDQFAASLTQSQWNSIVNSMDSTTVDLYLPKFKLEYQKELNNELMAMGMGIAFGIHADFSRISADGGLAVSNVLHQTFVEVNEEGTEAAAVTVIGIKYTAVLEMPAMNMNHSFIFAIRDHHTGTILFIGKVVNPNS